MQKKEIQIHCFRLLIGTLILFVIASGGFWVQRHALAATNPVTAAWEQARSRNAYHFASDLTQVTTPLATLTSVGRSSRQTTLHLEGASDLRASTVNLRLWSEEGSVAEPSSSLEVRVINGKTQVRKGGSPDANEGWQDAGDMLGGIAPSGDFMAFLAGLRDIQELGSEQRGGIDFTRYGFQLDGPAIADHMRDEIENALRQRGELPPGLELQAPDSYAQMRGSGELWVDNRGLPLRQILNIEFPAQRNETVTAHIVTTFSHFAQAPTVALLPADFVKNSSASSLGLLLGMAFAGVVVTARRSRRFYTALIIALIFAEVAGPLLQSLKIGAFVAVQTARAASQDEQQSEQGMATVANELVAAEHFDPNVDPVQAAFAQEAAFTTATVSELPPVPTPEPLVATDDGADTDQDGLTDFLEERVGTNPAVADTDGDQISDGMEVKGFEYGGRTWFGDPFQIDSNNDGQPDTVEWHDHRDQLAVDMDGDGLPDAFDEDNDGDGVADQYDLSPYTKMEPGNAGSSFNDSTPFNFQLSNLQAGMPVFVDFQLRPRNEKHLWYALSVLDWPQDTEGQIQDGDGKTYADLPGSDLNASPSDANGDLKLVPMLEIRTPTVAANLPTLQQMMAYGVASHKLTDDDANQVIYVPLRLTSDGKTGARIAFSGRMPYQASGNWSQPHQVRLVWLVQALLDSCSSRVDGQCVAYKETNQPEVIQSYYDDWTLTGLSVREDHGAQMAVIFESPAQDADLKDDAGLVKLAYGLEHSFLAGRDEEPDGQVDVTLANIEGAAARWNISESFQTVKGDYATFDQAVMTTAMTTTNVLLDQNFKSAWNNDHSIKPLLLFAHEESYRSEGLDGLLVGGTTQKQGALLTIDFNGGGTPAPVQTSVGMKWTMFCADEQSGLWQGCTASTIWDEVYTRYAATARLTVDGQTDTETTGQARLGLIRLYFMALSQGVSNIIKTDATVILPPGGFLRDDEVSGAISGAGKVGKGVVAFITSLATTKMELLSNDVILQIARLGAPKYVATLGIGGIVGSRVVSKLKMLWSQYDRAKIGLVGGIVGVVLITLALVATLAYFLATDPALRDSVVGVALGKVVPIIGIIVPLAALAASAVPLIQLARGLELTVGAQGALPKLLRGSSALAGTARISLVVGAAIQLAVVWGIFIYQMVSTNTPFFSPQFNAALAQVIAATVVILTLAVLSATVVGLLIVGVIAVIDAILTAICELGVDDLRKVPGLNGACFTLNTAATAGLAKLFYSFDSMIDTDRSDLVTSAGPNFALADPSRGFVANNPLSISLGITTTVVHKDPKPGNAVHILPYIWLFSEDNIRGTTFKYELTEIQVNVNAQRHQMDSAWSVSVDHRFAAKSMYRAQANIAPQVNNISLPVGLNHAPVLYLNTGYALPAYECWSTLGLATVCYVRTLDGHNSTKLDQFKLDILPATFDEFVATVDAGAGGAKLGWDPHFTTLADADNDGLRSHARQGNDPNDATWDSDGDGLSDALELAWRARGIPISPLAWNSDGDGLSDGQELALGTDPTVSDTDNDGLSDSDELYHQVYTFNAATGKVMPTNTWAGGWTVAIAGVQPLNLIVSSDPTSADGDNDGISDQAEKELATALDPDGRPYHPLLVNTNPLVVQVAVNDSDRIVKPGQSVVYSTTVTNLGVPLAAGGLEVRAPSVLGVPYSTYRLEVDQAISVTKATNFAVANVPSQRLDINSFARARLVNPNPTPWTWLTAEFGAVGNATDNRFDDAAIAASSATQQNAFAITAVKRNLDSFVNIPNRSLQHGDINAWGVAEGSFTTLDQDSNNTTALRTNSPADVACNATGHCLYVWDHYATSGVIRNLVVGALTGQNPTTVVRPQFAITENPAATLVDDFQPVVASDGTNFLVAWERISQDTNMPPLMYSQLVTRLFDADGMPLNSEQVFGKVLVSSSAERHAYMKLDVAWIGEAYRVAEHVNDNLAVLDFNSSGVYFGFNPVAANLHTDSWPRLAYNPSNQRSVLAYVDNTLQMHLVFFEGLNGNKLDATFGEAANAVLEIAYHPGTNDWLMAWTETSNSQLAYKLLKPDGVIDASLGTQFYPWQVRPGGYRMSLACPAATSQPALVLPFEELPGATHFADATGRTQGADATCAEGHCPLAGVPGAPQAPYSDYGVLFDATKQQQVTVAVPGISGGVFSIAFWYKIEGHNAMPLVAGDGWSISFFPGILYFKTANGGLAQANAATDDGQWHHVAVTDNKGFATVYLDGNQVRATAVDALTLPTPANLHIGGAADNSAFFNGTIDHLVVYAAALDAASVGNLYNRRLDSACMLAAPALNTFQDENSANDVGMVETVRLPLAAQDVRGGVLQASAGLSLTVDADAPTSAVDSLVDGSYVQGLAGGNQTLIIGGNANDANGIQQVKVRVNGGEWKGATGGATWVYPLLMSEGRYALQSQAIDVAGNTEVAPRTTTIIVDGTGPQITTAYAENATLSPFDQTVGQWSVALQGTVNDPLIAGIAGSGLQQVDVLMQSADLNASGNGWQAATVQNNVWSLNYSLPSAPALMGVYTVTVRASDRVGNLTMLSRHISLDDAGPSAVLSALDATRASFATSIDPANANNADLSTPLQINGSAADENGVESVDVAFVPIQRIRAISDTLVFLPFDELPGERVYHDLSMLHTDVSCVLPCVAGQPGRADTAIQMVPNRAGPIERQNFGEFNFAANTSFSVQSWLRTSQRDGVILSKEDVKGIGFALILQGGKAALRLNNTVVAQSDALVNDNQWHQIVGVVDYADGDHTVGQVQLYVDGVVAGKDAFSGALFDPSYLANPLVIGGKREAKGYSGLLDGWLDDVGVFNAALSPFLVQSLYNTGETIWQAATLEVQGATTTNWRVAVPDGLEGQYQIDLRTADKLANQSLHASVWRGTVDRLAPRINFIAQPTGARFDEGNGTIQYEIAYDYAAEDRYLDDANFSGPCSGRSALVRDFAEDADVAGLFPDLTLRNRLSTSCVVWETTPKPAATVSACDLFSSCATATPAEGVANQVASASQISAEANEPSALLLDPTDQRIIALEAGQPLTVTVVAQAEAGLRTVEILLDGEVLQTVEFAEADGVKSTQQSVGIDLSRVDLDKLEGEHTLAGQASDWAGNVQKTLFVSNVTFDTHDPVVDLLNDKLTGADGYGLGNSIMRLHGKASDSFGLAAVQISINQGPFADVTFDDQGNWSTALWLGDEPAGKNIAFSLRAIDRAGHQTAMSKSLLVDVPPLATLQTTINEGPANPTMETSARFTFSGVDAQGNPLTTFQCQLDGGDFVPCTSPQSYNALGQGEHIFRVLSSDGNGSIDPTPAERIWQIGTNQPPLAMLETTITAGPTNPSQETSATFSFSGVDGGGNALTHFECQLDGGSFTSCVSPQSYNGLAQGDHIFRVRSSDGKGATDLTPAERSWQIKIDQPPVNVGKKVFLPALAQSEKPVDQAVIRGATEPEGQGMLDSEGEMQDNSVGAHEPSFGFYLPLIRN